MTVNPQKLKGFKDYLPGEAFRRRKICQFFYGLAESRGFQTIDTPSLEYVETLIDVSESGDVGKELYRFKDHGDRDVAMRFDLTMPFSRFMAEHAGELNLPFKRVQIGTVWRGEKPQKGRYREFIQADLDIVAATASPMADIDLVGSFAFILNEILPIPAVIKVNDRFLLSSIMKVFAPKLLPQNEASALIALDKLEKIGPEKTVGLLSMVEGFTESTSRELLLFLEQVESERDNASRSEVLKKQLKDSSEQQLTDFFTVFDLLERFHRTENVSFQLAPSLARGLAYYTGIVFETYLPGLPLSFGSIASGGRYDNLISRFGKQDLCGVGGSLGVDRLLAAFEELKIPGDHQEKPVVYLALADVAAREFMYEIVHSLRGAGVKCEFSYRTQKIGSQIKHAENLGAGQFVVVGSQELANGRLIVKDLQSRSELGPLSKDDLIKTIVSQVKSAKVVY